MKDIDTNKYWVIQNPVTSFNQQIKDNKEYNYLPEYTYNYYSKDKYTLEQAQRENETNNTPEGSCKDCINCSYCINCTGCKDCYECRDCVECENCFSCNNCINCNLCYGVKPSDKSNTVKDAKYTVCCIKTFDNDISAWEIITLLITQTIKDLKK